MKVHLIDSDDPLESGQNFEANCGEKIDKAEFRFRVDLLEDDEPEVNALICCVKCRGTRLAKRYIYGCVSGQETKTAEVA